MYWGLRSCSVQKFPTVLIGNQNFHVNVAGVTFAKEKKNQSIHKQFHQILIQRNFGKRRELIWNVTKSLQTEKKKIYLRVQGMFQRDLIYKDIHCWPRGTLTELMEGLGTQNMIRVN